MTEQMTLPMTQDPPRRRYPQPTGMHYEGNDSTCKPIIIDAAEIVPGHFEIMAMRPGGEELEVKSAFTLHESDAVYKAMLARHTEPKPEPAAPVLTGKYAKLRDDLRIVHQIGLEAAAKTEDGGTCNFDAPALFLPRWKNALIEQACKEAGGGCFPWHGFGAKMTVVSLPIPGQADKRADAAEAMTKALKDMGYTTYCYQQMD